MPLRDITAFYEWIEREDPAISVVVAIKAWIDGLMENPWQSPSEPIEILSVPGEYQVREAVLFGVEIIYKEQYPTEDVGSVDNDIYPTGPIDLIDLRTRAD